MQLVQLLLPLYNQEGDVFPQSYYDTVKSELSEKFGGLTVYARSPAIGLWKENQDEVIHDDIITYEVMTQKLDRLFWSGYKCLLQQKFQQAEIVVRCSEIALL